MNQKNTMLMLPWIVLGILLLVGLLVSVLYTSITLFLNNEEVYHILYGTLFLVFGTLTVCK
jgi:putative Ca2+/H+ antiporter (TMEM165/GDT1 family)